MKKRNLRAVFASLLAASAVVGLASCGSKKDDNVVTPPSDTSDGTTDGNTGGDTTDGNTDGGTTQTYTVSFNTDGGSSVDSQTINSGSMATTPATPTKEADEYYSYTFEGWYTDEAKTNAFSFDTLITANTTLYAKWNKTALSESVKLAVDLKDVVASQGSAGKLASDITINSFTVESGAETRARAKSWTKTGNYTFDGVDLSKLDLYDMNDGETSKSFTHSVKINDKAGVKITASGNGIIKAYVQCGSSGAGLTGSLGVKVVGSDESETIIYIPTKDTYSSPMVQISFEAKDGVTYQILRQGSGTVDLYYAEADLTAVKSPVVGIDIASKGTTKFFEGEEFNTTGLSVNAVKETGATNPLTSADYTITLKKDGNVVTTLNEAGIYTVEVKYGDYEIKSYEVVVYSFDDIELGFNAITKKSNTSAGNGVYFNDSVQTIYKLNDTLDLNALSVSLETEGGEFSKLIDKTKYTVSEVDLTTAGEKEVTITVVLNGKTKTETYKIYVVDTALSKTEADGVEVAAVYVDSAYTGTIGATSAVNDLGELNTFKTISQALEFLGEQDSLDETDKYIFVAEGTYKEKIEVTLPNIKLYGLTEDASKVVIEWDSVYGIADESGYSNVTDSTQTLAVRESAKGFTMQNITVSNYYNNIKAYANTAYAGSGERALALLIQADQVSILNSRILGWQDTLELFEGRQYFYNTYICGTVDYIFGTNNTTLFESCEIETVKSKDSYKDEEQISAYVTAFKGTNNNKTVAYGAVFNNCNFTTSDDFVGKVALARPWGANSAVTYLNSTFSTKYSNEEDKTISNGLVSNVNVATLKLYVYGNKYKDGETKTEFTISEGSLTNINMNLTAEEAASYTIANIFSKTNGTVTYSDDWDPTSNDSSDSGDGTTDEGNTDSDTTVSTTTYNFNGETGGTIV